MQILKKMECLICETFLSFFKVSMLNFLDSVAKVVGMRALNQKIRGSNPDTGLCLTVVANL